MRAARLPGITYEQVLTAYCHGLRSKRAWIRGLAGELRPTGWPASVSWRSHAARWRAVRETVRRFVRGKLPDPCERPTHHWGGMRIEADRLRAERAVREGRWRAVDCGTTGNVYFEVVRRGSDEKERDDGKDAQGVR